MAIANITNNILTDSGILTSALVSGSGTTNYIPKFTGASALGNSTLQTDASGNLGLGVTPSAWFSSSKALQIGSTLAPYLALFQQTTSTADGYLGWGAYLTGDRTFAYTTTGDPVSLYRLNAAQHTWFNAPSGTAGNAITFTQAMTLTSAGRLLINQTSDSGEQLQVNGGIKSTATTTASSPSFATTVGGMFTDGTNLGFSVGTSRKAYLTSTGSFCVGSVLDGTTYLCNIGGNGYYNGGVYIQGTAAPNSAILLIGSGGTAASQIRLNTSTAPTSPTNGDIWFDGGSLKIQIGGVTKTVTVS